MPRKKGGAAPEFCPSLASKKCELTATRATSTSPAAWASAKRRTSTADDRPCSTSMMQFVSRVNVIRMTH